MGHIKRYKKLPKRTIAIVETFSHINDPEVREGKVSLAQIYIDDMKKLGAKVKGWDT